jgi:SAM-dependent methyltransferase
MRVPSQISITRPSTRSTAPVSSRCCACRSDRPNSTGLAVSGNQEEGLNWQTSVWDRMSAVYPHEVDRRFTEVIDGIMRRAALRPGERVLDLGTGTGSAAIRAASVGSGGEVTAVDISPQMLAIARERARAAGLSNVVFLDGRAEQIPAPAAAFDAVLASLSLMYVIDRAAAAREIARVLRPGGRLVAAVWGGPEQADIVLFQQTAGSFAPEPPIAGVGPGALAGPRGLCGAARARRHPGASRVRNDRVHLR